MHTDEGVDGEGGGGGGGGEGGGGGGRRSRLISYTELPYTRCLS